MAIRISRSNLAIATMDQQLALALTRHFTACIYRFSLRIVQTADPFTPFSQGAPLVTPLNDMNVVSVCHCYSFL